MDVAIWKAAEEGVGLRLYCDGVPLEHLSLTTALALTAQGLGWGARRPGLGNVGVEWELRRQRDAGSQG